MDLSLFYICVPNFLAFSIISLITYFHIKIFYVFSKKYVIFIPCEHKSFWQFSQLDEFINNEAPNLFTYGRLNIRQWYSEPSKIPKRKPFAKVIKAFYAKNSNLSNWVQNSSRLLRNFYIPLGKDVL